MTNWPHISNEWDKLCEIGRIDSLAIRGTAQIGQMIYIVSPKYSDYYRNNIVFAIIIS